MSTKMHGRKLLVILSTTALISVAALPQGVANAASKMTMPMNMPMPTTAKAPTQAKPAPAAKTVTYKLLVGTKLAGTKVTIAQSLRVNAKSTNSTIGSFVADKDGYVTFTNQGALNSKTKLSVIVAKKTIETYTATKATVVKSGSTTTGTVAAPFVAPTPATTPATTPAPVVTPATPVVPAPVAPVAPVVPVIEDALVPALGAANPTADGYTIQIANYDSAFTWSAADAAGGSTFISSTGQITVTKLAAGTKTKVTVTSNRTNFKTGTASSGSITVPAATAADLGGGGGGGFTGGGSGGGSGGGTPPPAVDVAQTTLVIANSTLTGTVGTPITLSTAGGSGSGAVTYAAKGSGCSIASSTLTAGSATTCIVTATKAASTGFLVATSASKSFVFSTSAGDAAQATLVISNSSLHTPVGTTFNLTTSGGSGSGAVSFIATGSGCLVTGSVLSAGSTATNCVVTATKASSAGFLITTSASVTFVFVAAGTTVQTLTVATPFAMRAGGANQVLLGVASSNLPITFTSNSGTICTVSTGVRVSVVQAIAGGTCSITATQAGDSTYASATSTISFSVISSGDVTQNILVLDLNGGTLGGSSSIASRIVSTTAGAQTLGTPTNGSLTFQGWHVNDVAGLLVSDPYTVSTDVVLVAKWA